MQYFSNRLVQKKDIGLNDFNMTLRMRSKTPLTIKYLKKYQINSNDSEADGETNANRNNKKRQIMRILSMEKTRIETKIIDPSSSNELYQ